jgi:CRISPR system Cascade subunit CasE
MSTDDRSWLAAYGCKGEAEFNHALVWTLFLGDGAERDFVFRREQSISGVDSAALSYLIVSARRPVENRFFTVECKPYAPRLAVGERLCFDLRANPVINRKMNGKAHRHDVLMDAKKKVANTVGQRAYMDAAAMEWLVNHAPHWGLEIHQTTLRMDGYRQMALFGKGRTASFSVLDYLGLAVVTDTELLLPALTVGVGHARSYGCGLLLVKRIR